MKRIISLFAVFMIALPISTFSQNSTLNADTIIGKLRKKYSPEKEVHLLFDLTIFWSIRERYEKKEGELLFNPGEKFRLKLGNSTWVSNGQTYWQYSKSTNQVIIKSLLDIDLSLHPSNMLQSFLSYSFKIHSSDAKSTILNWEGESQKSDLPYKKIVVNVDNKKFEITELIVTDDDGNESRYIFNKTKFGEKKPSSIFEFIPPEGVDILDTRK